MTLRFRQPCTPVPVTVEHGEDIGGIKIIHRTTVQIRCGCRHDLGFDYGHEQETP